MAARTWEPITFLIGELDEFVPPATGKREGDAKKTPIILGRSFIRLKSEAGRPTAAFS